MSANVYGGLNEKWLPWSHIFEHLVGSQLLVVFANSMKYLGGKSSLEEGFESVALFPCCGIIFSYTVKTWIC